MPMTTFQVHVDNDKVSLVRVRTLLRYFPIVINIVVLFGVRGCRGRGRGADGPLVAMLKASNHGS